MKQWMHEVGIGGILGVNKRGTVQFDLEYDIG